MWSVIGSLKGVKDVEWMWAVQKVVGISKNVSSGCIGVRLAKF